MKKIVMRMILIFFFIVSLCVGSISYFEVTIDKVGIATEQETVVMTADHVKETVDETFMDASDFSTDTIRTIISCSQMNVRAVTRAVTFYVFLVSIFIIIAHVLYMSSQTCTEVGDNCHLCVIGYIHKMDGKKKTGLSFQY